MLEPKLAILDETDGGLDIDACLRIVAHQREPVEDSGECRYQPITHYRRLLRYQSRMWFMLQRPYREDRRSGIGLGTEERLRLDQRRDGNE